MYFRLKGGPLPSLKDFVSIVMKILQASIQEMIVIRNFLIIAALLTLSGCASMDPEDSRALADFLEKTAAVITRKY